MGTKDSHSRKALAKLIHTLPSHCLRPRATLAGMEATSISSSLTRIPSRDRNPTMILGTPRRKDWIQNLRSFRSKLSLSRSPRMSIDVLSSTQLIGSPALGGLESHTVVLVDEFPCVSPAFRKDVLGGWERAGVVRNMAGLTGIDFTAEAEYCLADAGPHN